MIDSVPWRRHDARGRESRATPSGAAGEGLEHRLRLVVGFARADVTCSVTRRGDEAVEELVGGKRQGADHRGAKGTWNSARARTGRDARTRSSRGRRHGRTGEPPLSPTPSHRLAKRDDDVLHRWCAAIGTPSARTTSRSFRAGELSQHVVENRNAVASSAAVAVAGHLDRDTCLLGVSFDVGAAGLGIVDYVSIHRAITASFPPACRGPAASSSVGCHHAVRHRIPALRRRSNQRGDPGNAQHDVGARRKITTIGAANARRGASVPNDPRAWSASSARSRRRRHADCVSALR